MNSDYFSKSLTTHASSKKEELAEALRQGSEARHYGNRHTPDGIERVEMIPLGWAIETFTSELTQALKEIEQVVLSSMADGRYDVIAAIDNKIKELEGL